MPGIAVAALAVAGALAVLAADQSPPLRLPPDLVYGTAKDSPGPVVFSHVNHVAIADNTCTGCHPAAFRMLKPTRKAVHDEMNAGRSCGMCHDGKTAIGVQDDCAHCHKEPAAAAAAPAAPAPAAAAAPAPAAKGEGS